MVKILNLILIALGWGSLMAILLYKLVLMFRHRNDPEKLRALVSVGQVFPKRIKRFIYDEDADTGGKASVPNSPIR